MTPTEMETLLRNIDARTTRIEQILPTLATRNELAAAMATLATKEELARLAAMAATKEALAQLEAKVATKEDLAQLTARVAELPTRAEMKEGLDEARRHALVLNEAVRDDIRLLAEYVVGLRHP